MKARAAAMIERFGNGVTATISRRTAGTSDPTTGKRTGTAPLTQTVKVAIGALSASDRRIVSMLDLTINDAAKVYCPAVGLSFVPDVGDEVTLPGDAKAYTIRDVGRSRPDGDTIYRTLYLGRTGA